MAPHSLTELNDTSAYYPSTAHDAWSQTPAYHKSLTAALNAKIACGNYGFGRKSPKNVWNLSSGEVSEVEKSVRNFLSMRATLFIPCPIEL